MGKRPSLAATKGWNCGGVDGEDIQDGWVDVEFERREWGWLRRLQRTMTTGLSVDSHSGKY